MARFTSSAQGHAAATPTRLPPSAMVQKVPAKVAAKAAGKRKQAEEAAAQGFDDAERAILPGAEAQDAQRRFGQPQNPHDPPEAHALGAAAEGLGLSL